MEVRGVRVKLRKGTGLAVVLVASPSWRWSLKPGEWQNLWWIKCREPFQTPRGWERQGLVILRKNILGMGKQSAILYHIDPTFTVIVSSLNIRKRTTTVHGIWFPPESDHHLAASCPPTPGFPGHSYISKPFCVFSYVSNFEHSISCNSFPSTWKTHLCPPRLCRWNHSQL